MWKKAIYITGAFSLFMLLLYARKNGQPNAYRENFREADRIFNSRETTEDDDRRALQLYEKVIGELEASPGLNDSVLFQSYVNGGMLLIGLDGIQKSVGWFNAAIATGQNARFDSSRFFLPHLYCGRSWYTLGQFDSALYHYKIAERIGDARSRQNFDRERLFNMLGAVYYDLGNYKQSVNYFEKALQVLSPAHPDYTDLFIRYKNNISGCLIRLDDFDKANAICDEVLEKVRNQHNPIEKIIWHRKAIINLQLGAAKEALRYLGKVGHYEDRNEIKLLNDFASVYLNLEEYDSAGIYIQRSLLLNRQFYPYGKNPDLGVVHKLQGELNAAREDIPAALREYQLAIITLVNRFADSSVYSNPDTFTGVFAANNLLEILMAKAALFEKWHTQSGGNEKLEAAIDTYASVFVLTDYMQRIYDTDEARLLLNKKKYAIHDNPIRLCVRLYRSTGNRKFLEKAFYFDEQNKASVLNENLAILQSRKQSGLPAGLLEEEKRLKQNLTARLLKATQVADEATLLQIQNEVRDEEIALNKLYQQLAEYPAFSRLHVGSADITAAALQKKLDAHTLMAAYHLGETELTCFWFSKNKWDCFVSPLNDSFLNALQKQVAACRSIAAGSNEYDAAPFLYRKLISPLEPELAGIRNLVIIPDDELHQLPFESLPNEKGEPLGARFGCCYNYSANLAFPQEPGGGSNRYNTLAMAPFAQEGTARFGQLPHSGAEINITEGKMITGKEATRERFLQLLPQYRVLHLATHASAGTANTPQPFIAFSQQGNDTASQYLYSDEIVNLDMDSVSLVYLSACETGYGQLVRGEGMMSLSRAFAYAGCADIVTSLWQADDEATAIITRSFYKYYYAGHTPADALKMAKTDYLNDPAIDKRKKTPFYWAHLVFVGQQPPAVTKKHFQWWWLAVAGALAAAAGHIYTKRKRR